MLPLDQVTLGQRRACLSVWSLQQTEAGREGEKPLQLCSQEPGNNENPVNIPGKTECAAVRLFYHISVTATPTGGAVHWFNTIVN